MTPLITQAIEKRRFLRLIYDFQVLAVAPYVLGKTTDGMDALLARQLSPLLPPDRRWRLLYLDWIYNLRLLDFSMPEPRPQHSPPVEQFAVIYMALQQ